MSEWSREQKCLKALSEDREWRRSCDVSRQVVPYRDAGRALWMCDCWLWIDEWSVRASDQSRTNAVVVVTACLRHEWSRTGSNSVQRNEWLDMLKLPIWRRCAQGYTANEGWWAREWCARSAAQWRSVQTEDAGSVKWADHTARCYSSLGEAE